MGQASYPAESDLLALLTAEGFTTSGLNLAAAIAAGIARFERETGRRFLDPAGATTRTFDPPMHPRGQLDLRADIVAPLSGTLSATYQTTALVIGTDWRPMPQDAPARSKPYYRAQFIRPWWPWPIPQSVWGALAITGVWAYGLTIPDDVWQAMIFAGALSAIPSLIALLTGGATEMREADMQVAFGLKPFGWLRDYRQADFDRAVASYRRVTQF